MCSIKNPWGDGRDADVLDDLCCVRSCLRVGEDKGTYTPGRGYTSYHAKPRLVCMTRMLHGCPDDLAPDPKLIPCCGKPDFAKPRGRPFTQRCRSCFTQVKGRLLELRRAIVTPPGTFVDCRHSNAREIEDTLIGKHWICHACTGRWRTRPAPMVLGRTYGQLYDDQQVR